MQPNILITGASSGIGYHTALQLCGYSPCRIIAVARRGDALQQLREEAQQFNPECGVTPLPYDLTLLQKGQTEFLKLVKPFLIGGRLSVLINNAGYLRQQLLEEMPAATLQRHFLLNAIVPALLIRLMMPYLHAAPAAHVVNVSSMAGFQGSVKFGGLSVYSASKAALHGLTEGLATEYSHTAIRFNALALGAVDTPMFREAFKGQEAPLTSQEMGEFIARFAMDNHRFFNGKVLPVAVDTP